MIDMMVGQRVTEAILIPFTYFCNLLFQISVFPDRMKISKVRCLYKSDNKHSFTNYRNVSLLQQFSVQVQIKQINIFGTNRLNKIYHKIPETESNVWLGYS